MPKSLKYQRAKKNLLLFCAIILLFGMAVGIYYGNLHPISQNHLKTIQEENTIVSFLISHFSTTSSLFVLSFFFIGVPLAVVYLFIEGLSLGVTISLFISYYQLHGLLYIILFFLFSKIPFYLFYLLFLKKLMTIQKAILFFLIKKINPKEVIIKAAIGALLLIFLLCLYDLFFSFIIFPLMKQAPLLPN